MRMDGAMVLEKVFRYETAFDAICRHYLHWNQCARFMDGM